MQDLKVTVAPLMNKISIESLLDTIKSVRARAQSAAPGEK